MLIKTTLFLIFLCTSLMAQSNNLLWNNTNIGTETSGIISTKFGGLQNPPDSQVVNAADDFIVPEGVLWHIDSLFVTGFTSVSNSQLPENYEVVFYENDMDKPGSKITQRNVITQSPMNFTNLDLKFNNTIELEPGKYWISIYANYDDISSQTDARWNWTTGKNIIGDVAQVRDLAGIFGGMDWTSISDLGISENSCYYSIFGIETSIVSSVDFTVSAEFKLAQNYPNPFNPSTTISFAIPADANVSITVFNTLGQEVAKVVNNNFTAGNHKVDFNASSLTSGMYIYRLDAQSISGSTFSSVKKMMLMK